MNAWMERLRAAFAGLQPRERWLVGAAAGLVVLAILYAGVVMPLLGAVSSLGERRDTAEQQLRAIERLRRDYDEVAGRLGEVERRIEAGARGNLRTTLESLASEAQVRVESMEPQASPANDAYRETKVEVSLKEVSLAQTVSYLHGIEASPQVLSIKSLRIRSRPDDSGLLDVSFTVSSFEPI